MSKRYSGPLTQGIDSTQKTADIHVILAKYTVHSRSLRINPRTPTPIFTLPEAFPSRMIIHRSRYLGKGAATMIHAPEYGCNQRHLTEHELTKDVHSTGDRALGVPELDKTDKTAETWSNLRKPVMIHQQQPCSNNLRNQRDTDYEILALESKRHVPRQGMHGEQDDNRRPSSIQLPKYHDDRDSSIIHFGTIGTHEGKTFIPKRTVHRNALDDLAHLYDEDQDFYVLDVNLDGDQIDHLLHCSETYYAEGEYTSFLQKTADCLLTVL